MRWGESPWEFESLRPHHTAQPLAVHRVIIRHGGTFADHCHQGAWGLAAAPKHFCLDALPPSNESREQDRWYASSEQSLGRSRDVQPESLFGVVQLEEASQRRGKERYNAVDGNHL